VFVNKLILRLRISGQIKVVLMVLIVTSLALCVSCHILILVSSTLRFIPISRITISSPDFSSGKSGNTGELSNGLDSLSEVKFIQLS
jgi:hypothetical protein